MYDIKYAKDQILKFAQGPESNVPTEKQISQELANKRKPSKSDSLGNGLTFAYWWHKL